MYFISHVSLFTVHIDNFMSAGMTECAFAVYSGRIVRLGYVVFNQPGVRAIPWKV